MLDGPKQFGRVQAANDRDNGIELDVQSVLANRVLALVFMIRRLYV